jgi:hypothetical protein
MKSNAALLGIGIVAGLWAAVYIARAGYNGGILRERYFTDPYTKS